MGNVSASEKKQKFLSRVEDHPGLSQQRMQVPISSVNQQLSLSRTPRDPRHWSVTNLHKLSDQYCYCEIHLKYCQDTINRQLNSTMENNFAGKTACSLSYPGAGVR
jgi:hypothetical protein